MSDLSEWEPIDTPPPMYHAIFGQESSNNPIAATSVDGAMGMGQIIPATFKRYALPGEDIRNPADNEAVGKRIIDDLHAKFKGDPARIAVGYFSGPGNVAPADSPTPWKNDTQDGNGKKVSSYVSDIMQRMGTTPQPAAPEPVDLSEWEPIEDGFSSRLGKDIDARVQSGKEALVRGISSKQGAADTALQLAGNVYGGVGDLAVEAIKSLPDAITQPVTNAAQGIAGAAQDIADAVDSTEAGKAVGDVASGATKAFAHGYNYLENNHPALAANIEALANIASVAPMLEGVGKTASTVRGVFRSAPKPIPAEAPPSLKVTQEGKPLVLAPKAVNDSHNILTQAFQDEEFTPQTLNAAADKIEAANKAGIPYTALDALTENDGEGRNLGLLLSAAVNRPGQGARMAGKLAVRGKQSATRIGDLFNKTISDLPYATVRSDAIQSNEGTGPLYKQAYAANQNMMTPAIRQILSRPAAQTALKNAATTMQNAGSLVGVSNPDLVEQASLAGQDIPNGGIASGLKMRTLSYVKKELWDLAQKERDPVTARYSANGRAILSQYHDLNNELKTNDATRLPNQPDSGLYAQANKQFTTAERQKEALELGRKFDTMDAEDIKDYMQNADISDPEKSAFLSGARRKLKALAGTKLPGQNPIVRVNNVNMRERYEALLGPQKAQDLIDGLDKEQHMHENNSVLGGSITEPRRQFNALIDGPPPKTLVGNTFRGVGAAMEPGMMVGKAGDLIDKRLQKIADKLTPDRAAAIVRVLTSQDPKVLRYFAERMNQ